jgi:hypothetical protein
MSLERHAQMESLLRAVSANWGSTSTQATVSVATLPSVMGLVGDIGL